MLNTDLGLQNQYDDRRKPKQAASTSKTKASAEKSAKSANKKRSTITNNDYLDNDNGFHFSAYVPVGSEIWKLDGLDRQPRRVGVFDEGSDWMSIVAPIIQEQLLVFGAGDIETALLSICADPVLQRREDLTRNIKSIRMVQAKLDTVVPDWKVFTDGGSGAGDADAILEITEGTIDAAETDVAAEKAIKSSCPESLTRAREHLIKEQQSLRSMLFDALSAAADDEKEARERRNDYSPVIRTWLTMLAEKEGVLQGLLEDIR